MKKQMLKKLTSLVLAAVMTASLLVGCGNSAQEEKQESQSVVEESGSTVEASTEQSGESIAEDGFEHDPVLNELGADVICKKKVTLTIGLQQNANVEDYETNYYTKKLEEEANVDLEFVLFPAGNEGKEKLRMMIAGDEELPDIIMFGISGAEAMNMGAEGYILPLEDYFQNSSYYAKNGYDRAGWTYLVIPCRF